MAEENPTPRFAIRQQVPSTSHSRKTRTPNQSKPAAVAPDLYLAPKTKMDHITFDAEYLQRLKANDPDTAAHFETYFRPRLRAQLNGYRLWESDKQDIIQETFLGVTNAAQDDQIRSSGALGAFVSKICRNVASAYWDVPYELDIDEISVSDPGPSQEALLLYNERIEQVEAVLNELSAKDRNLLRAKIFEGLTSEEMVDRFGVSKPEQLRLMLHRARKRFAERRKKRD